MRFERLHLRAFGPFTDEMLDLSGGTPGGLHVVYGPNEAGKSTSLRAVTGFLFGIPHRTGDAHLHPLSKLSISATISSGGVVMALTRLKRRKDDLVGETMEPLAQDPLPGLLGNLDEKSFTCRFGLDQIELERGAEALLGGSEQGLFAAGTAGAAVRRVLDELESSADELFRHRGKKPPLNIAIGEYERVAREARRAERPPEKWLEEKRTHDEAVGRVSALKKEHFEARAELRRLNRLRGVLSDLTAWEEASARRTVLGDEPSLPEDATEVREKCERKLSESRVEERHLKSELATFEEEVCALPPESPLVEVDEEQLQLSNRAGTAISARKDLPKRQASLLEQIRQVRGFLSDLGVQFVSGEELAKAREILPSARAIAAIRELATEHGALVAASDAAGRTYLAQEREVARLLETEVEVPLSASQLSTLEAALADAQAFVSQFHSLLEDESESRKARAEVTVLRAELGTKVPWTELSRLVPGPSLAALRVNQHRSFVLESRRIEEQLGLRRRQCEELETRLREERHSDVPTEERLFAARLERDSEVDALQRSPDVGGFLKLRALIGSSDQISDRLRREADRVAALAAQEREVARLRLEMTTLGEQLSRADAEILASEEAHRRLCEQIGIASTSDPSDAEAVFERLRLLVQAESKCTTLDQDVLQKGARVREQERRLRTLVPDASLEGDLPSLIVKTGQLHRSGLHALERAERRTDALFRAKSALVEAARTKSEANALLRTWETTWQREISRLGLSKETSVKSAQEALSSFDKLGRVLLEADNLERRIAGMERDTQALADDVRGILSRHLPELLEADPVDAALQLQERIRAARRASDERARYRKLIAERKSALSKVESAILAAEGQIEQLVQSAGLKDASCLPLAEEQRREIRTLERRLEKLETSIREKAEGSTLSELTEEAAEWRGQSSALSQRVYELEQLIEELEEAYRNAEKAEASIKMDLDVYRSEDVVEARQRVSIRAEEARTLLREYLVKKAAHGLLRAQMEAYAEQFSGPILVRASEMFERMTLGRYAKLSIGLGERTLHCVREGQQLEVSQLSRGTRAQLYFALRLASLEKYFEDQPAIPLVFDDLFVDFDDDRTTAAFEVVAELATKTQILYFTHLARDVEAAHNAVPSSLLFEHRLTVS